MKIEVGKFYKTREGSKVRIYAIDGVGIHSVHGSRLCGSGKWIAETWCSNGKIGTEWSGISVLDIVSEWIDPKPRMFAYRDPFGRVALYSEEDHINEPKWTRAPWLDEPEIK